MMIPRTAPGLSATGTVAEHACTISSVEDVPELVASGNFLECRSGVGNGDEVLAHLSLAHRLLHAFEKILLEDIGLERASRLAGDNEQRGLQIELSFKCLNLGWIGGVQHVEFGEALGSSKGHAHDFWSQARTAHTQQCDVAEASLLHFLSNAGEVRDVRKLVLCHRQPSEPIRFVGVGPK